jgi:molecular chaperone GrpE (heat shock protein)
MEHRNHSDQIININVIMQQELNALRERIADLECELEEQQKQHQQQRVSHKDWIRDNLEEAQQIIDNIVGIKGITEDPLKVAADLEGIVKLTPHTDTTNASISYGWNVIAANTAGTLGREVVRAQSPHQSLSQEELFGY